MSFVLDTPEQIEAYRLLATHKGLELEIKWGPRGGPTRGMALASARRVLAQYEFPGPTKTRRQCHAGMHQLCLALNLIREDTQTEETSNG